jgi:hypothetical protein
MPKLEGCEREDAPVSAPRSCGEGRREKGSETQVAFVVVVAAAFKVGRIALRRLAATVDFRVVAVEVEVVEDGGRKSVCLWRSSVSLFVWQPFSPSSFSRDFRHSADECCPYAPRMLPLVPSPSRVGTSLLRSPSWRVLPYRTTAFPRPPTFSAGRTAPGSSLLRASEVSNGVPRQLQ